MNRRDAIWGAGAAVVLALPLLPWFAHRAVADEGRTGLLLVVVGLALGVSALLTPSPPPPSPLLRRSLVPAWLLAALTLGVGLMVGVRLLQATGVVGLVWATGMISRPERARITLPALALVLLGLPLSGDIDVVGFPLRLWSAQAAALVLPMLGVPVVAAETVLVTEGGIADVEAPCAGLATIRLLIAAVLVLAAVLRARPRLIVAAVLVAAVTATVGNALRVTVLTALVLGAQQEALAAVLHVPLGIVVFLAAAMAALPLLRASAVRPPAPVGWRPHPTGWRVHQRTLAVAALVVVAVVSTTVRASRAMVAGGADAVGNTGMDQQRLLRLAGPDTVPLTAAEHALYDAHAVFAVKQRLPRGELLLVAARSLRAIHPPERCLASNGHHVDVIDTGDVDGIPYKILTLNGGAQLGISLMTSGTQTVSGLSTLALARLGGGDDLWVFASAVVDRGVDVDALVLDMHRRASALTTAVESP